MIEIFDSFGFFLYWYLFETIERIWACIILPLCISKKIKLILKTSFYASCNWFQKQCAFSTCLGWKRRVAKSSLGIVFHPYKVDISKSIQMSEHTFVSRTCDTNCFYCNTAKELNEWGCIRPCHRSTLYINQLAYEHFLAPLYCDGGHKKSEMYL